MIWWPNWSKVDNTKKGKKLNPVEFIICLWTIQPYFILLAMLDFHIILKVIKDHRKYTVWTIYFNLIAPAFFDNTL